MNPALIMAAVLYLSKNNGNPLLRLPSLSSLSRSGIPSIKDFGYFDTFRMEMLLDRLHSMTNTLEKVNHLNQMKSIPLSKDNSIDRIQESLEAVKGLLYANKSAKPIDNLSNTLSNVKQLGDMQGLMTNMGPIFSMLSNKNDK